MVNTDRGGERTQTPHWFSRVIGLCLLEERMGMTDFLHLFMVPMCAPNNQNFGKQSSDRRAGRTKKDDERSASRIAQDQRQLLEDFLAKLENCDTWEPSLETDRRSPLRRAVCLADRLVGSKLLKARDVEFCRKPDNCKGQRYLSIFSNAKYHDDMDAEQMMKQVVTLYRRVLKAIYLHEPSHRLQDLAARLEKALHQEWPDLAIPQADSWEERTGWMICAMLMLAAWKDAPNEETCRMVSALLHIPLDCAGQEEPTVQAGRSKVWLSPSTVQELCLQALGSEMDPDQIQTFYYLLCRLREQEPTLITAQLLDIFTGKITQTIQSRIARMADNGGLSVQMDEIGKLDRIRSGCTKLLTRPEK